jgi:protein O-GlcNAc transferase
MTFVSEAIAVAMAHHRAGRLEAAEQLYRQVIKAEPNHAEAWHLLGLVNAQIGNNHAAVEYIRHALTARPEWPEALANLGNALRAEGNLNDAVSCLRRALELKPDYAVAHNNLGNVLKDQGNLDEAIACYRGAADLNPNFAEAHNNLGSALKEHGDLSEAVASCRRAIELKPDYARAHYNLGVALRELGKNDEAITQYRRAVDLQPSFAPAHNNLGNALRQQGNLAEAVACYRRALERKPDYATAHNNMGIALGELGHPEEAIACYGRALELNPGFAEAHNNLGNSQSALGKRDLALVSYRRALELKPDFAEALYNLGSLIQDQREFDEAIACYRRALELNPTYADAHTNLGNALRDQGNLHEAIACHRRALEHKQDYAEAHNNLGNAFRDQGNLDEAIACYRRALAIKPDSAVAHSNLLYTLHYHPGVTPAVLAEAHAEYDTQHATQLCPPLAQSQRVRNSLGRLRLGFVSPDLARHPVGYFLVRVLENIRGGPHETICYSDRIVKDALTSRLQSAASQWRDVHGMSDDRLAEKIRADQVDILFDLAGHTAHNRLLVFARKPAPIQISWIGYEGTTGLAAMDYLIADRLMIPEGAERHYRERVLRMPDGYLCYDPPEAAPPVSSLPSVKNGFTAFGSFNNPAKITPVVVLLWATILNRLPTARLIMKYRGLGDPAVKQRFLDLFATHGIGSERLDLLPWSSYSDYLATYHQVDVALDPFPFSGSTITCESLWMGVPVITCPGDTFASRHSLDHLTRVGLTETIARDTEEYAELALSLAGDPSRLAALRSGLRNRMAASPLCDGERFAESWLSLLQSL